MDVAHCKSFARWENPFRFLCVTLRSCTGRRGAQCLLNASFASLLKHRKIAAYSDARVGGMLAGKPGLLHLHLGTGGSRGGGAVAGSGAGAAGNGCPQRMPFQTLADAVEGSDVPVRMAAAIPTVSGGSGSVPCGSQTDGGAAPAMC